MLTLAIALFIMPPALWAADRMFNRGELFALLREELNIAERPARIKAPRRPRMTVARR